EVAFAFTADVLRRMAIPPLVRALRGAPAPELLDVACGTGRFLAQLARALPNARIHGVDLSPYYVAEARRVLARVPGVALGAANAEALPFPDARFDAASSIFLFHELPRDARRNVVREVFRVLRPGARFVVCDSAQADSTDLTPFIEDFSKHYHE